MTEEQKPSNIYNCLGLIIEEMDAIGKTQRNTQQNFRFRGIDDVYNSLHPLMAKHGVVCLPSIKKVELSVPGANSKGNNIYRSVVTVGYRFTACDGSSVDAEMVGEGFDFGDKATSKAVAMAHKYMLLQTFMIPTEDLKDADSDSYEVDSEEKARRNVMKGGPMELPEDQERKLEEKRAEYRKRVEEAGPETNSVHHEKPWPEYAIQSIETDKGKILGKMEPDRISFLRNTWVVKYAHKINSDPIRKLDALMIVEAFNYNFPEKEESFQEILNRTK